MHNALHGNDPKRYERLSNADDLEELWADVLKQIDELVHLLKPKKTLFLAVDGVAPRAKMNHQRARRFNAAKEASLKRKAVEAKGGQVPKLFDSN